MKNEQKKNTQRKNGIEHLVEFDGCVCVCMPMWQMVGEGKQIICNIFFYESNRWLLQFRKLFRKKQQQPHSNFSRLLCCMAAAVSFWLFHIFAVHFGLANLINKMKWKTENGNFKHWTATQPIFYASRALLFIALQELHKHMHRIRARRTFKSPSTS